MDLRALRNSGIVVSGALIGGAVLIAMTAQPVVRPRPAMPPQAAAPVQPARQPATFALSFRGDGPLARAQRLAMRGGREHAAQRQVERALARQRAFRGLCFDHFTARGDVVVRVCVPATGADWFVRLRAVPAVTNVDATPQLTQDGRGD